MALKGTSQDQSKFFVNFIFNLFFLQMSSQTMFTIINWGEVGGDSWHVPHRFLYLYHGTVSTHHLSQYLYILVKCMFQLWVILGMSLCISICINF